jgi:hypothetical protein
MGELEPWIDENFVRNLWFQMGEQVNVKMIRDKFSGYESRKQLLESCLMLIAAVMPDIASSTFPALKLLPKPLQSTAHPCQILHGHSSSTGHLVEVLPIEGEQPIVVDASSG